MEERQNVQFNNSFARWQNMTAFNTYWQYSMVNRSLYYANIASEYREYMVRWVENYLWWYDGWVPYFHNADQGIFSTKLAAALVNGTAKKVIGGHIYFKNKNKETPQKGEDGKYIVNKALAYITSEWSDAVNFPRELKKAVTFAAAAGTSLLKLDKQGGKLIPKALRFDSFYPVVGFNGQIVDLVCFIRDFTKLYNGKRDKASFESYYVVEHRYFGDYREADGKVTKNKPLVEYEIRYSSGSVVSSMDYAADSSRKVDLRQLKDSVRRRIVKAFDGIALNKPIPLPFHDSLGAELVNWTDCVSAIPELPFGDSLLVNIMPYLQSYDYYWSAFNTDMYLGRGRVLLPKPMQSPKVAAQNSGWDSMLFTAYETMGGGSENKNVPTPVQFDLRSSSWKEIRDMIVQNIAMNTGMNLSTIASFLNDTTGTRTAREISTEESETALFVEDKREILEKPVNRILKLVTLSQGFTDDVVIRWSETGLTNPYTRTEMLATALAGGFVSRQTAAQMFRQDDDEYQQAEEWERIQQDRDGDMPNYIDSEAQYAEYLNGNSEPTAELTGNSPGRSGNEDQADGEGRVLPQKAEG